MKKTIVIGLVLIASIGLLFFTNSESNSMNKGNEAPTFSLPNQDGNIISMSDHFGKKPVVIFFYPAASSPGCTAEACSFRDQHEDFVDAGAAVFGISKDDEEAQSRFKHRHEFPFDLLADTSGKVHKLYDVGKIMGFLPSRITYVIDKEQKVRLISDSNVFMGKHASEALDMVRELAGK